MMKLTYTDEQTFLSENVFVSKAQYNIAKKIQQQFNNTSPIMVHTDKQSILFCVDLSENRIDSELGVNAYRVIIEKI